MLRDPDFRILLNRSLAVLAICVVAVVVCYFYIDRPVAYFVHRHERDGFREFRSLTEPPPLVQIWSPLLVTLLIVRRAWGPWQRWQHVLFLALISLIVADQFRLSLGDLFGRYWPETWHDNNPSLIKNGAYRFHPFQADDDNGSFPSGHAARILAFFTVFWLAAPRGRWLYAVVAAPMLVALVVMNYHFVGDVIAGSALGGIIGAWAVRLSEIPKDFSTG